jgi:hypothetical protein
MDTTNTFPLLKALLKEKYAKKLKEPQTKATAQLEASKDPMKYLEKNKNLSWKHLKGIAF